MLPDFPEIKRLLRKMSTRGFKDRVEAQLGPFGEAKRYAIHEGTTCRIEREDGRGDEMTMEEISTTVEFSADDVASSNSAELQRKLDEAADEMARRRMEFFFRRLDEEIRAGGVVVDGGGERLSPDHVLEMLSQQLIDFDDHDRPYLPTLVVSPKMAEAAEKVMYELTHDPDYRSRLDEVMKKKHEEWRAREANRRLAD